MKIAFVIYLSLNASRLYQIGGENAAPKKKTKMEKMQAKAEKRKANMFENCSSKQDYRANNSYPCYKNYCNNLANLTANYSWCKGIIDNAMDGVKDQAIRDKFSVDV
jgi:hypothetical protein